MHCAALQDVNFNGADLDRKACPDQKFQSFSGATQLAVTECVGRVFSSADVVAVTVMNSL